MTNKLYKQLSEKPTETVKRFLYYNNYLKNNRSYNILSLITSSLFGDKYERNILTAVRVLNKRSLEGKTN